MNQKVKFCNLCKENKKDMVQFSPENKTTFTICRSCWIKYQLDGIEKLNMIGVLHIIRNKTQ